MNLITLYILYDSEQCFDDSFCYFHSYFLIQYIVTRGYIH